MPSEARRCSFCDKTQSAVAKLISGSGKNQAYICDTCVRVCNRILDEAAGDLPLRSHGLLTRIKRFFHPMPAQSL